MKSVILSFLLTVAAATVNEAFGQQLDCDSSLIGFSDCTTISDRLNRLRDRWVLEIDEDVGVTRYEYEAVLRRTLTGLRRADGSFEATFVVMEIMCETSQYDYLRADATLVVRLQAVGAWRPSIVKPTPDGRRREHAENERHQLLEYRSGAKTVAEQLRDAGEIEIQLTHVDGRTVTQAFTPPRSRDVNSIINACGEIE